MKRADLGFRTVQVNVVFVSTVDVVAVESSASK